MTSKERKCGQHVTFLPHLENSSLKLLVLLVAMATVSVVVPSTTMRGEEEGGGREGKEVKGEVGRESKRKM